MEWTNEQKNIIDSPVGNILVSAAAGSGKTTVLVERIIRRISDDKNPVDIDSLLIATFTNAAAADMKKKIAKALKEKIKNEPENKAYIRQLSLLDNASIGTIDSFCLDVVNNYFNNIGLDPATHIADKGEISLVQNDILDKIFEEKISAADENFIAFLDSYMDAKNFDNLKKLIIELYDKALNFVNPMQYIQDSLKNYDVEKGIDDSEIWKKSREYLYRRLDLFISEYERIFEEEENSSIEQELEEFRSIRNCISYSDFRDKFRDMKFKKACGMQEQNKARRNAIKKEIKEKLPKFLLYEERGLLEIINKSRKTAESIIDILKSYEKARKERFERLAIANFADIEQYAYGILNKDGKRSAVAKELSEKYSEIYIDEYQDINSLQEAILNSISRDTEGEPNVFMVGDVKQSIYGFRYSSPEFFIKKYNSFSEEKTAKEKKAELHSNFRSEKNVLDCVNDVFFRIMTEANGDVVYNEKNCLNYGLNREEETVLPTQIRLVPSANAGFCAIALEIKRLHDEEGVGYGQCAILYRKGEDNNKGIFQMLKLFEIPAVCSTQKGYFEKPEINNVLQFLRIIDNPRQDIPVATVMKSFFFGFSEEELAMIRGKRRKSFIECVYECANREDELSQKCRGFCERLNELRELSVHIPLCELVYRIIHENGYYDYAGLSYDGKTAQRNLEMLASRAKDYMNTNYAGLNDFLRYIDKMIKYDTDYGEAEAFSGDEAVSILTMHKSKGLEFDYIFLADIKDDFANIKNETFKNDKTSIVLDDRLGLAFRYKDSSEKTEYETLHRTLSGSFFREKCIAEELRLLYVALTRAKKQLYIYVNNKKDILSEAKLEETAGFTPYFLNRLSGFAEVLLTVAQCEDKKGVWEITEITDEQLQKAKEETVKEKTGENMSKAVKLALCEDAEDDAESFDRIFDAEYFSRNQVHAKYAVSDLKHRDIEANEDMAVHIMMPERKKPVPSFAALPEKEEEENGGSNYGNAYHKFFELLDYTEEKLDKEAIIRQMDALTKAGKIPENYRKVLNPEKFIKFLNTDLGKSMQKFGKCGKLFREQPFVTQESANRIDSSFPEDEKVIIQGIIDAFYIDTEKDEVVLIDYKTDNCDETILVKRYATQLSLYEQVLLKISGCSKCRSFIYSVHLDREIELIKG